MSQYDPSSLQASAVFKFDVPTLGIAHHRCLPTRWLWSRSACCKRCPPHCRAFRYEQLFLRLFADAAEPGAGGKGAVFLCFCYERWRARSGALVRCPNLLVSTVGLI
jgi:hypothetical protein